MFDAEREREEWEELQQLCKEREQVIKREHLINLQTPPGSATGESAVQADEDELEDARGFLLGVEVEDWHRLP